MTHTKSIPGFPCGSRVDQGQLVRQAEGLLVDAADLVEKAGGPEEHAALVVMRRRIESCLIPPRPKEKA